MIIYVQHVTMGSIDLLGSLLPRSVLQKAMWKITLSKSSRSTTWLRWSPSGHTSRLHKSFSKVPVWKHTANIFQISSFRTTFAWQVASCFTLWFVSTNCQALSSSSILTLDNVRCCQMHLGSRCMWIIWLFMISCLDVMQNVSFTELECLSVSAAVRIRIWCLVPLNTC